MFVFSLAQIIVLLQRLTTLLLLMAIINRTFLPLLRCTKHSTKCSKKTTSGSISIPPFQQIGKL